MYILTYIEIIIRMGKVPACVGISVGIHRCRNGILHAMHVCIYIRIYGVSYICRYDCADDCMDNMYVR